MQVEGVDQAPQSALLIGAAAWFIPGLGHALMKRWIRAVLMGGAVWLCFILGLAMGGHMFDLSNEGTWFILRIPPVVGNLGMGALYIVSWLLGYGFTDDPQQAARATYEYGNIFLLIAGLINYLNMLDAYDIAAGRKQ